MPLHIFDDEEFFKMILEPYEQKFDTNLNSKNVRTIIDKSNTQISQTISNIVNKKLISLKIDVASSIDSSLLTINIQYIKNYKICVNTIGLVHITKNRSAVNLKEDIMKCLGELNITINQIYSNTIDDGANMIKVSKLLREMQQESFGAAESQENYAFPEIKQENTLIEVPAIDIDNSDQIESQLAAVFSTVRCAAHTINLAAYEVLKSLEVDVEECRIITKKLSSLLKLNINNDNKTRWKCTYEMINSILCYKAYIENLNKVPTFDVNWTFVENFVMAFKPLVNFTAKLQHQQYIIGNFFRDWLTCELELADIMNTNSYAAALHTAMNSRKDTLLQHNVFVSALYLDPRFNFCGTPLLTNDQKQTALDHLMKTYELIRKIEGSTVDEENTNIVSQARSIPDEVPCTSASAYDKLTHHIQNLTNTSKLLPLSPITVNVKQNLLKLCERTMEPFDTNVLKHWKQFNRNETQITKLAEVVLAVPVTQVSVERAQSALSTILTKGRSKTFTESPPNMFLTKFNFELLDISKLECEDLISS